MGMTGAAAAKTEQQFSLDPAMAGLLAQAQHRLGQLEMLGRLWPLWPRFAAGPLSARAACLEASFQGRGADLAALLACGPELRPSRPHQGLRRGVGCLLALRRLQAWPAGEHLTPSLVSDIFFHLDAPHLARGAGGEPLWRPGDPPVAGASVWSLAPRWLQAGLPSLMAAGLALAAWEREGPDHPLRGPAGRVLLMGLAPRLGLPSLALSGLGQGLARAARDLPGGLEQALKEVRAGGAWRRWMSLFLAGVEAAAGDSLAACLAAHDLAAEHRSLVLAWARAPKHPLRLLELLAGQPVLELPEAAEKLEVTQRTAGLLANKLKDLGILRELTGQRRGRRFGYQGLLAVLA